ncbi:D-alanyl-D-alanine carboxypeptidase family protein [Microbaculum sp. FT89]|uniref:D-alanyl-D-alanine carboxypeptidase family protein n=1 Tax=Microbaculum sp. FT89 TaxID=3447298 RepID=UPI003F53BCD7
MVVTPVAPALAQAIETAAPYAYMIDDRTGTIVLSKESETGLAPASMAKLMTLEIVFEAIKEGRLSLDDEFVVSENAWRKGGAPSRTSTMFAGLNTSIRLEDLLKGIMVQNANDGCIVIAEGMAGNEQAFAVLMNERARMLGLSDSTFVNSTGLPNPDLPKQTMSMRDLVTLARHVITEHPDLYRYFSEPEFTWNNIRQLNKNPIIGKTPGADGLFTGYDEEDGYGMIASADQDGQRMIAAIHGLSSNNERINEMQKLLAWGFRSFEKVTLFQAGEPVAEVGVFGGTEGWVPLAGHEPIQILIPRGAKSKLRARIVYQGPLRAPVEEGQQVGELEVMNDQELVSRIPLYATRAVEIGPLYSRALDAAYELMVGLVHSGVEMATKN